LIAIDSSVLIAILSLEPDAQKLLNIIARARAGIMSAVSLLESSVVLAARKKEASIWQPFDEFLSEARIEVMPFDENQAHFARSAFLKYGKGRHPAALNFGDCAAYALAKSRNVPLLFKGDDFRKTDIVPAL
jgi:ribonuclease VapC